MRILLTFIAFLPSIIAKPAFPDRAGAQSGTNEIITPKNNFKPFGDQPFGDQPFGDQPHGVWPWGSEEPPAPQGSGDPGIYAPPTKPWYCPPDRPIPLCCDGKSYGEDVETGCSACVSLIPNLIFPDLLKSLIGPGDGKLLKCNIMLDQFCCSYHYVSSPSFTAWGRKRKRKTKKHEGGF